MLNILKNKIYIGFFEIGKRSQVQVVSPHIERLQIIDNQLYYETQKIIKKNTSSLEPRKVQRITRHGSLLLAGLLYRGECGLKYTSQRFHQERYRSNGDTWIYERTVYRCRSFVLPQAGRETCERRIFNGEKIEALIIKDVKNFISEINKGQPFLAVEKHVVKYEHELQNRLKILMRDKMQREKELKVLNGRTINAIIEESQFDQKVMNGLILFKMEEVESVGKRYEDAKRAMEKFQNIVTAKRVELKDIFDWEERFDAQDKMGKKIMLANIIDKITVFEKKLEVKYQVKSNNFGYNSEELDIFTYDCYNCKRQEEESFYYTGAVNESIMTNKIKESGVYQASMLDDRIVKGYELQSML